MTQARQRIGRLAEDRVAERLGGAGWRLLERNARTRFGEIDIVALAGPALVFVEVKAGRLGGAFGPERPVLAVAPGKQRRIRRLAAAWIAANRASLPHYRTIRFDAVGVTYDATGNVVAYEHIQNAF